jgi:hypothetical protein
MAPDLTSRLRWSPALLHVIWLRTSPYGWGCLRHCHVSYGSIWAASFKHKEKPSRSSCAARHTCFNAHAHVSKTPHIRVIICLQDVQAVSVVNICKACGHASIVRLQYDTNTMNHSVGTAIVPNDSTARCHTANRVQHDRWQDQACLHRWRHYLLLIAISVLLCSVLTFPRVIWWVLGLIVTTWPWVIKDSGRRQY